MNYWMAHRGITQTISTRKVSTHITFTIFSWWNTHSCAHSKRGKKTAAAVKRLTRDIMKLYYNKSNNDIQLYSASRCSFQSCLCHGSHRSERAERTVVLQSCRCRVHIAHSSFVIMQHLNGKHRLCVWVKRARLQILHSANTIVEIMS